MRYLIAFTPLALLAACGGDKATSDGAGGVAANVASAAPIAPPTAMPGPGAVSDAPAVLAARADMVAECLADAPPNLPAGTDPAALCGCAVDRVMAGSGRREAVEACAANMGATLPPR